MFFFSIFTAMNLEKRQQWNIDCGRFFNIRFQVSLEYCTYDYENIFLMTYVMSILRSVAPVGQW